MTRLKQVLSRSEASPTRTVKLTKATGRMGYFMLPFFPTVTRRLREGETVPSPGPSAVFGGPAKGIPVRGPGCLLTPLTPSSLSISWLHSCPVAHTEQGAGGKEQASGTAPVGVHGLPVMTVVTVEGEGKGGEPWPSRKKCLFPAVSAAHTVQ